MPGLLATVPQHPNSLSCQILHSDLDHRTLRQGVWNHRVRGEGIGVILTELEGVGCYSTILCDGIRPLPISSTAHSPLLRTAHSTPDEEPN